MNYIAVHTTVTKDSKNLTIQTQPEYT